ncbi:MAG TPA: acyltransferase [Acidimicrobiales bacterium]|nr:acyltransferase [Acidimicrobiales bacterium]
MTGPSSVRQSRNWPSFDGIRAVSVLAIIMFHANYPSFIKGGYVAVDLFFTVSGFLITWLLVSEFDKFGGISYRKFYTRRALRLFPALAVVIVALVILVLADGGLVAWRHLTLVGVPYVVLYTGNWAIAFGNVLTLGLLSVTWTLAIEEQYYFLWPLALTTMLKRIDRQRIAFFLLGVALLEQVVRFLLGFASVSVSEWAQKSTLTHSDGLLLGSALALMWTARASWKLWPAIEKHADVIGATSAVVLGAVMIVGAAGVHQYVTFLWITLGVYACAALIIALVAKPDSWLSAILSWRPLVWVGKRSYGIYLWHFAMIELVGTWNLPQRHVHFVRFVLEVALTFAIATVSYRFIELPFLNRKTRYSRVSPDISPDPAPAV